MTLPRTPISDADLARMAIIRWEAFTYEDAVAAVEMWNAGASTEAIAEVQGRKPGALRTLIAKLNQIGISLRKAGPPQRHANLVKMYDAGMTATEIAKKVGISRNAVIGRIARAKETTRIRGVVSQTIAQRTGLNLNDPRRADRALRRFSWERDTIREGRLPKTILPEVRP